MKRLIYLATVVLLLIGAAQGAFAHDYWDHWSGNWQRGTVGSTYQHWDFSQHPTIPIAGLNNPFGTPQIIVGNGQYPDVVIGPDGLPINTWHLGSIDPSGVEQPGTIDLFIPNRPMDNPIKLVYVQITSDKYTLGNQPPLVNPPASSITSPGPIVAHGTGGWYTYNWLIEIRPNPEWERLVFQFPYSTNVSQIVVDTICTVPEPSSLASLASGLVAGLALVRRRRR